MEDCAPVKTPMVPGLRLEKPATPLSIVLSACDWQAHLPDIAYTAGMLAHFNNCTGKAQWTAVKHLLCYIKGTIDYKLHYGPHPHLLLLPPSQMPTMLEVWNLRSQPLGMYCLWVVALFPGPPSCSLALLTQLLRQNSLLVSPAPGRWPPSGISWRIWATRSLYLNHLAWTINQLFG